MTSCKPEARPWLWLLVALLLLPLMPSTDSMWIDEAQTWRYVRLNSFADWRQCLLQDARSEAQMPLGMFAAWASAKVLGSSELALRLANLPWAALALLAIWLAAKRLRAPWLVLLFAVQPFLWFYVNEARPYALQIAAGAWLWLALVECLQTEARGRTWPWIISVAGLLLCGSSMLGVFPFAAFCAVLGGIVIWKKWPVPSRARLVLGCGAGILLLLGAYYLFTLRKGAGGAKIWGIGLQNVFASCYELAGFSGLGPQRQDLRTLGRLANWQSLRHTGLSLLGPAALALSYFSLLAWGLAGGKEKARLLLGAGTSIIFLLSIAGLFAAARAVGFPFWGRHLSPLLPFFFGLLSCLLADQNGALRMPRWPLLVFGALLLVSSLELRFASRHKKDDYRTAAAFARGELQLGHTVWWAANPEAAEFYGLVVSGQKPSGKEVFFPTTFNSMSLDLPDALVLSKPDIFDAQGMLARRLETSHLQVAGRAQAFVFWKRK